MASGDLNDPLCVICREPCSVHVPTEDGPLTCPRLARGEGRYVLVSPGYILSGCMGRGPGEPDDYVDPVYRFEPFSDPPICVKCNREITDGECSYPGGCP